MKTKMWVVVWIGLLLAPGMAPAYGHLYFCDIKNYPFNIDPGVFPVPHWPYKMGAVP